MNANDKTSRQPLLAKVNGSHDYSRELAAYEREQDRLVAEHLGKIALVRGDQVVGVFDTANEAIAEGFRRFGNAPIIVQEIRDPSVPLDYISSVDVEHPSVQLLPENKDAK